MTFEFFNCIEYNRQSNAQFCCPNIIGHDAEGYCLDAHEYLPAGSTLRQEPTPDMTIEPFCSTYRVWREAA